MAKVFRLVKLTLIPGLLLIISPRSCSVRAHKHQLGALRSRNARRFPTGNGSRPRPICSFISWPR
jgi:hypothetical protein